MVYDKDVVCGQVHVELEAVRARRESCVEGRDRVLRPERAAAAMGEDQWNGTIEEVQRHASR